MYIPLSPELANEQRVAAGFSDFSDERLGRN